MGVWDLTSPSHIFPIVLNRFTILHLHMYRPGGNCESGIFLRGWRHLCVQKDASKKWRFQINGAIEIKHRVLARRVFVLASALILVLVIVLIFTWVIVCEIGDLLPCFLIDFVFDIAESDYWPFWWLGLLVLLVIWIRLITETDPYPCKKISPCEGPTDIFESSK